MQIHKSSFFAPTTILMIFALSVLLMQCNSSAQDQSEEQEEVELALVMSQLQTHAHKYALSVEEENHELASFYLHEMEESSETIAEEVPTYEGYEIAELIEQYLEPQLESSEEALESRDWDNIRQQTIKLVDSCNSCHAASDHGFVKITPGFQNNPFNQDFSPSE